MKHLVAVWSIQEIRTQFNPQYIAQEEREKWNECNLKLLEEHKQEQEDCCGESA